MGRAAAWLTVAMVAAGALAAVLRFLARPLGILPALNALQDAQWMLFALVVVFGAAWALRDDAHVRVDVLQQRLSARARAWIELVGSVLALLPFCALLAWALWPLVSQSVALLETAQDPGGLPRWPVKALLLPAVALLALQGVAQALGALRVLRA